MIVRTGVDDATVTVRCTHCDEQLFFTYPDIEFLFIYDDADTFEEDDWYEFGDPLAKHATHIGDLIIEAFDSNFAQGFDTFIDKPFIAHGHELVPWYEELQNLDDEDMEAYVALAENHHAPTYIIPAETFLDSYIGHYDSFDDYMWEQINSDRDAFFENLPDDHTLVTHFDHDGYFRDAKFDYTVLDAPKHGCFIYHD